MSFHNEYYVYLYDRKMSWNLTEFDQVITPECNYFGEVLLEMEKQLDAEGLVFYLTNDLKQLPSYGANVVAVVIGDEWCRIPLYAHRVKAIFKCYGTRPALGCNPFLKLSYLNLLVLIQYLRIQLLRVPGVVSFYFQKLQRLLAGKSSIAPIYDIPIGYYKQLDLPLKPIEQRTYDMSFRGSVVHRQYPLWSLKRWLKTPKNLSRQQMLKALEQIQKKYPDRNIQITTQQIFAGFAANSDQSAEDYSQEMMNTKICLVPRGTSFETYRFFEALRYGCIVIAEALPPRWFYEDSPVFQIDDWCEVEPIMLNLDQDQQQLRAKHQASLDWWHTQCSGIAVGSYMANQLNQLNSH